MRLWLWFATKFPTDVENLIAFRKDEDLKTELVKLKHFINIMKTGVQVDPVLLQNVRTQRRRFTFEESYWRVLVTSYGQCQNLLNEADHFERLKFSASAGHVLRLALSNLSKLDVLA